jgi:hypothetical protein
VIVTRSFMRTAVPALALALVLSAAPGCGSDDSGGSGTEEERIKEVFAQWQEDFTTGKGPETCARLTDSGRKELLAYRDVAGYIDRDATCAEVVSSIIEGTEDAGVEQKPAKVLSAKVSGNTAIAQVSDAGRPAVPVRLIKQNGEWKLPSAGFGPLIGNEKGDGG